MNRQQDIGFVPSSQYETPASNRLLILLLFVCQTHHCGTFIQKYSSIIKIFLSLTHPRVFDDFFLLSHVQPPPYVFTPTPAALTMQTMLFLPTSCWSVSLVRVEHCSFSSVLTSTPPLTLGVSVLRYGSTETPFGCRLDLLAFFVTQLEWKHIAKTKYARMLKILNSRVNFEIYCIRLGRPAKETKPKQTNQTKSAFPPFPHTLITCT